MSEILELVLELVLNMAGCILEAMADIWLSDLRWPNTTGGRTLLCIVVVLISSLIWWELR